MSISVSSATQVQAQSAIQPAAANQSTSAPKPQVAAAAPRPVADTVKISAAAQALQEAVESPVQTAKEARAGDGQARRLLAKEAAAKVVTK